MTIFSSTTFTWYQLGALKWAVFLIGLAAGATWPKIFAQYAVYFLVLGILLSLYVGVVWFKQK